VGGGLALGEGVQKKESEEKNGSEKKGVGVYPSHPGGSAHANPLKKRTASGKKKGK